MANRRPKPPPGMHVVTAAEIEALRARMREWPREPLRKRGSVTTCPECKGRLVTTNDLEYGLAIPGGLLTISRLSGAKCTDCGTQFYDGGALALIESHRRNEIVADYETRVTHTAGRTLGTYFRSDLVRVLGLKGKEILKWKVVGRNRAVVDIER